MLRTVDNAFHKTYYNDLSYLLEGSESWVFYDPYSFTVLPPDSRGYLYVRFIPSFYLGVGCSVAFEMRVTVTFSIEPQRLDDIKKDIETASLEAHKEFIHFFNGLAGGFSISHLAPSYQDKIMSQQISLRLNQIDGKH